MDERPHPVAIFLTPEDHVSWDKYDQQNDVIEGLTDDERQHARTGITYLRRLLGEDYLRRAVQKGNPIFGWFFANAAPHARRSLIRLAEELKSFENADGFKGLVARLKNAHKAVEALTVLGAASNFSRVGFNVSFDPPAPKTRKVSDLLLTNCGGEQIYVEVSRLRRSEQHELNSYSYNVIHSEVLNAIRSCADPGNIAGPHVRPYARILRSIRRQDLRAVVEQIRKAIFDTAKSNEYREFRIGNLIEMAVSPAHDHRQAELWAKERGITELVDPPKIDFSRELRRARDKIRKEMRQLPRDKPGVITVPTENLLFFAFLAEDIITVIAEELRRHRNLLCATFSDSFIGDHQEPTVASHGQHAFVTTMNNLATYRVAFMMNESFGLSISTSTLERVRSAFVHA